MTICRISASSTRRWVDKPYVSGQVVEIAVRDNQLVRKGQLLFRIDPEPYAIAVEQAEARLGGARLQVEGLKATYRRTGLRPASRVTGRGTPGRHGGFRPNPCAG